MSKRSSSTRKWIQNGLLTSDSEHPFQMGDIFAVQFGAQPQAFPVAKSLTPLQCCHLILSTLRIAKITPDSTTEAFELDTNLSHLSTQEVFSARDSELGARSLETAKPTAHKEHEMSSSDPVGN